jgi:hypothetical protein
MAITCSPYEYKLGREVVLPDQYSMSVDSYIQYDALLLGFVVMMMFLHVSV